MLNIDTTPSCKWRLNDTFEGGRLYQLIGENGSGKSTLGKIITGIEPVSTGTATVNGKMLQHMSQNEKRETFFYIPQEPHWLFIGDTFCQNLRYFSKSIKECADTNNIGHNEQHRQKLLSTIQEIRMGVNIRGCIPTCNTGGQIMA
ncbi:ATP-binding cassette domain-containing protein [Methanothrix soehngenii]|uniref:ATP-binding cassette domain-containing protein n=1 Tax=Methanothrix soehngenii TaxID=2223 RepID=UPI00300D6F78